jgi:hypothetical protein
VLTVEAAITQLRATAVHLLQGGAAGAVAAHPKRGRFKCLGSKKGKNA